MGARRTGAPLSAPGRALGRTGRRASRGLPCRGPGASLEATDTGGLPIPGGDPTRLPTEGVMAVTGVSPSSGPTGGGTSVTITGSGFGSSVSGVLIGGTPATFTVVNGTTIRATTPAHAAGTVSITVTTPSGPDTGGSFSYLT